MTHHSLPVVTVFGASRVGPESELYAEARELGRLLAEAGYVLCNGGFDGTMEAASRGAKEAGGRTIGVTVNLFGAKSPNEFLDEELGTASLLLRLDKLTEVADAFVVLAGGIGTFLELALVWNLKLMHVYPRKPIILVGPAWQAAIEAVAEHLLIREIDLAAFTFVETPREAVVAVREALIDRHG